MAKKYLSLDKLTEYDALIKEKIDSDVASVSTVEVSDTEPTKENVELWLNPSEEEVVNIPEINDSIVSEVDTWSSKKISDIIGDIESLLAAI